METTRLTNPSGRKIKDYVHSDYTSGDLGIELELEGTLYSVVDVVSRPQYWLSKPEPSLRNGIEYVLKQPVTIDKLSESLQELGVVLTRSKPRKTIRCSTHYHVNVRELTFEEVFNVLGYYYLIEDILVRTQGPIRTGNLFCLRMSDAEYTAQGVHEAAATPEGVFPFQNFDTQLYKYGALNLAAICMFGSLEFRFLLPITDMVEMEFWGRLFYTLIHNAKNIPVKDSLRNVEELSPKKFLRLVFDLETVDRLTSNLSPTELNDLVLVNYEHVFGLKNSIEKRPRSEVYKVSPDYLMHDLSPNYGTPEGEVPAGSQARAKKLYINSIPGW